MENAKKITCVCAGHTLCLHASKLESDLNVKIVNVEDITNLFELVSNCKFHTDFICIDLNSLVDRNDGADVFDIVNALYTMIKCTVYKTDTAVTIKPPTKIGLMISDDTDPHLVRVALKIPDVFIGTSVSDGWDVDLVKENLQRNLAGDFTPAKHVLNLIKTKKKTKVQNNDLMGKLTPREAQILSLIQTRGASNKTIAKMLDISESTVKLHISHALKKYGCKNRTQLALFGKKDKSTEV